MTSLINASAEKPVHILTVDLEDYFHVEAFAGTVSRSSWDQYPCRVVENCHRLLDIFDRHQVKATFFVLGWIADRFPALIREVHDRGHELACHSFWHRKVDSLTPAQFRADTREACDAIEQAASVRVSGYRAPTWSITRRSLWALDILEEEGFEYDSSIYPIHHDLYGIPGANRYAYAHVCENGESLLEFPPATARIAGMNFPAAGGGYLRIFPSAYTSWVFKQFESAGRSLVLYLHPWEIDPEQPRIRGPLKSRFRHYTNLHRTEERLERVLKSYRFAPFRYHLPVEEVGLASSGDVMIRSQQEARG
ncbi:MAG TPA: XrtA system polysaccharide deacetylase [Candidatus Angelobacter sp.]|nr:XrtA system polysaccharide deacetylase [Candidatus Angelobacter sp.]